MMPGRLVEGGTEVATAMLFGRHDKEDIRYINEYNKLYESKVVGLAKDFVALSDDLYNKYRSDETLNRLKGLYSEVDNILDTSGIIRLSRNDIPNASQVMARWILAHPIVRKKLNSQTIDGYSEFYTPTISEENIPSNESVDYLTVVSGLSDDKYETIGFFSDSDGEDLSIWEQMDILETWEEVDILLENDIDPTC